MLRLPVSRALSQSSRRALSTLSSKECIALEEKHGAHNYSCLPVVFSRAEGVHVWDPEGHHYYDFLSAYSAVNQGHCHPKITKALTEQASRLCLSSRAFHSENLGPYEKFVTELFGYDMVLPMNSGVEAVETSFKLARKWAYQKKGVPENEAIILHCSGSFHGRTMTAITMSTDPTSTTGYGPFVPGVVTVQYNNIDDLESALKKHSKNIAGFIFEPIQGEAGVVVPDDDYLRRAHALCKEHNVLFIADEVQTGIGRTGKMLCMDHVGVRPDVVTLGKALSGGVYPVSAVLADKEVMLCIERGTHGSTFGGNPLACAVATAALQVIVDEKLAENAERLGKIFREGLRELNSPLVTQVRGKGLLNAMVIAPFHLTAYDLCLLMKERGVLAKPTQGSVIRLAPPLVITEEQIRECIDIIGSCLHDIQSINSMDMCMEMGGAEERGF